MINQEDWQALSALLDQALALDPAQRPAWLAELSQREPALGAQVARMLALSPEGEVTGHLGGADFQHWLGSALTTLAPVAPDLTGQRLGAWELQQKIGEGGMGQVWRARRADGLYQGSSAIKLLRSDLLGPRLEGRFARERAVLARLNHPAIARLLDAGVAQDQAYLVLELVPGQPLNEHVRQHCPSLAQRVSLLLQVAQAVDYAHAQLVVHRDIKPSNVMVTPEGAAKLLDFGVAGLIQDDAGDAHTDLTRQTGRGLTLGYAAPEQITGGVVGTAADVFALGVLLFELISGGLPFGERGGQRVQFEHAVLHDAPRRIASVAEDPQGPGRPVDALAARGDLEAVAAKALRKDPAQRYGGVRALMDDLQHWQEHRPVSVRRENRRHNARLWLRRHALLASSMSLLTLSLSAGLGASLWQWQKAQQAVHESDTVTDYLRDMLASASPDKHGGQWPTVLQLLEKSRKDIDTRFASTPGAHLRVLQVLAQTYTQLSRYDLSVPLAEERLRLTAQQLGEDDARTLDARIDLARSYLMLGQDDLVIAAIAPELNRIRRLRTPSPSNDDERLWDALTLLDGSYAHLGRVDEAERALAEAKVISDRKPANDPLRADYLNHLAVVRVSRNRIHEALAVQKQTQPFWVSTDPNDRKDILNQQGNLLMLQMWLAEEGGLDQKATSLLEETDRVLTRGSGMALQTRQVLATYYLDTGQWPQSLRQREDNLAYAHANGVTSAASELRLHSQLLRVQAQTHSITQAQLRSRAQALLDRCASQLSQLGKQRIETWFDLAAAALAYDDSELAARALALVRQDRLLRPGVSPLLAARLHQSEGQLARLQGDLTRSRELLQQRLAYIDHLGGDHQLLPNWAVALNLAYTQVLQGDAAAANATLDDARARRPTRLGPGHPLDLVEGYLRTLLTNGGDESAPAVREAKARFKRYAQGLPEAPATSGLGSLYGLLY